MRLVAKLTVGLMLGMCAVLAGHAWLRVERERRLIESDMAREQRRVGQVLALVLPRLWQDGPDARAQAMLDTLASQSGLELRLLTMPSPALPGVVIEPRDGDRRLVTRLPLPGLPDRTAAIELSESLADEDAYVRTTLLAELATVGALGLSGAAIAVVVGLWLVGRPSRRLVEQAERIGAGDFTHQPAPPRRDELGDLARAMNGMAERLALMQGELAAETAQRLAALEQMRHADRLATIGTLASGVAHELGTPLNVVAEYGRLIERAALAPAALPAAGRTVVEQAERMTAIIRTLLDFARRRPRRRAPADLRQVAERTLALLAPLARDTGVRLDLDVPDEALRDAVDADQLQQALANLVVNAIHAEPRGGRVHVRVARGAAQIAGGAAGVPRCLQLVVTDHGCGIDPAALPHVFEPFFTTKPIGKGTGLGLSVAQGIVIDHGGWIAIDNAPGGGTRATIVLPQSPHATDNSPPATAAGAPSTG